MDSNRAFGNDNRVFELNCEKEWPGKWPQPNMFAVLLRHVTNLVRKLTSSISSLLRYATESGNPQVGFEIFEMAEITEDEQRDVVRKALDELSRELVTTFDNSGSEERIKGIMKYIYEWLIGK